MEPEIKVSVIVTSYNLEAYIGRAIRSCLNQSLPENEYEVIVVDDASTDRSVAQIKDFGQLIQPIFLTENGGVAAACNVGIRHAQGRYIIRVDGDDFVNRNLFFVMSEVLDANTDIGFVYCDYIVVTESPDGSRPEERTLEVNTLERLLDHGAGMMFRKEYMEALGLYDPELSIREDYDLTLRYLKNFDGYHLRLPYYRYIKREGSLTTMSAEREELKNRIRGKHG